jgi:hypothetical protein
VTVFLGTEDLLALVDDDEAHDLVIAVATGSISVEQVGGTLARRR